MMMFFMIITHTKITMTPFLFQISETSGQPVPLTAGLF